MRLADTSKSIKCCIQGRYHETHKIVAALVNVLALMAGCVEEEEAPIASLTATPIKDDCPGCRQTILDDVPHTKQVIVVCTKRHNQGS